MRQPSAYPVYLDFLQVKAGKRLLDVGCGPGWLLKAAVERGLEAYGFDFSEEAIKLSRQNSPSAHSEEGDVTQIRQPDQFFDYITCIGVLEHFLQMDLAIKEMKRIAKPKALFCIMVPNSSTLFWKLSQLFSYGHRESNENAMTLKEWKSFFKMDQFHIKAIFRDQWNIFQLYSLLGLGNCTALIRGTQRIVRKLLPMKLSRQFIFILENNNVSVAGKESNG
jgi:ubiquinone/menaquinone biosynthesis C-methylase UbiE